MFQILVTVNDLNDCLPVFDNVSYIITIPEGTANRSNVFSVKTTDADATSDIILQSMHCQLIKKHDIYLI
jgi:hypothetical protein